MRPLINQSINYFYNCQLHFEIRIGNKMPIAFFKHLTAADEDNQCIDSYQFHFFG